MIGPTVGRRPLWESTNEKASHSVSKGIAPSSSRGIPRGVFVGREVTAVAGAKDLLEAAFGQIAGGHRHGE